MRSSSDATEGPTEPVLGPLVEADLEAVLAIERSSFSRPWERRDFLHEIRGSPASIALALRVGTELAGFAVGWLLAPELSIVRIAIDPAFRRRGFASRLMRRLIEEGTSRGCSLVVLEVRESAVGALRLYRGLGFTEVGRRRGYYERDDADALLFELRL
jgi:ribosomal-protein-alanine N-acetyltransferase